MSDAVLHSMKRLAMLVFQLKFFESEAQGYSLRISELNKLFVRDRKCVKLRTELSITGLAWIDLRCGQVDANESLARKRNGEIVLVLVHAAVTICGRNETELNGRGHSQIFP